MQLLRFRALAACALLAFPTFALVAPTTPQVLPPTSHPLGLSYSEWSSGWWQWFMQHPIEGHPAIDDPSFDVSSGQSGKVWYLATPLDFGPWIARTRTVDVPAGKSLFAGLLNTEMSSLEGVASEEEQGAIAGWLADHIVDLNVTIDGVHVADIDDYRVQSKQFTFTAPDPWIFGPIGAGEFGTSVADGYFLFLAPMSVGQHVLHVTGGFYFEAGELGPDPLELNADMTYVVNVY
ncbi:MAG TPA: hypothetical protein VMT18_07510 [Planctomycetota bacterium]|nr:hypothetical protein [Planctomycetota bacterium]